MEIKHFLTTNIAVFLMLHGAVLGVVTNKNYYKDKSNWQAKPKFKNSYTGSGLNNHWQANRRIAIPSGTVISLTPSINIPILANENDEVGLKTSFGATFPMTITFKDLSLGSGLFDWDFLRRKKDVWDPYQYNFHSATTTNLNKEQARHKRKSRDANFWQFTNETSPSVNRLSFTPAVVKSGKCPTKSLTDRKTLLEQIQIAGLRMFGVSGSDSSQACLLRAICEIHEVPIYYELGLLGEIAKVVLSFKKIYKNCENTGQTSARLMKFFKPYVDAEIAGQSNQCASYMKNCSRSIFTYE